MSRENVEVATQAIGAFNEREIDAFATLTTPDFEWSPSMVAIEGETFLGHEGIETYFGRLDDAWEKFHIHRDRFRDSAEVVVMLGRLEGHGKSSGVPVDASLGMVFDFRDGLISRIRGFLDHAEALRAAGLSVGESDAESFRKPAEVYDRFVGRYGRQLAREQVAWIGIQPDWKVLDVGCGPGPLTSVLATLVPQENIAAVDPSEPFVASCMDRLPGADVRVASAEELPFGDAFFDATCSQLVVNFLSDAPAGLAEMRRVARPGGLIAASVWDYAGEMTMLRAFWDAALEVDPAGAGPVDEGRRMPYCEPKELARLWSGAGLAEIETDAITVSADYEGFEDLWTPFGTGVGPAGAYAASLPATKREELRDSYRRRLGSPDGPFELSARAWVVRGTVPNPEG